MPLFLTHLRTRTNYLHDECDENTYTATFTVKTDSEGKATFHLTPEGEKGMVEPFLVSEGDSIDIEASWVGPTGKALIDCGSPRISI